MTGFCEHGNELSDSVKGWEFLDYLSDFSFSGRTVLHSTWLVTQSTDIRGAV
jgi:hypothetical protein